MEGSGINVETSCSLRYGYVSAYDAKRHMARITFPDKDNLVSHWLPVLVWNSKKNKHECHLDIDEHVACLMLGNGLELGIVLGAVWDDKNLPPCQNHDRFCMEFDGKDGSKAHILVDRAQKIMQLVDFDGSFIKFANEDIVIQSKHHIHLNPHTNAPVPLIASHVASTLGGE